MRRADFAYELPEELIAQQPLERRSASRLLCLDGRTGRWSDSRLEDLPDLLDPGDLLVFNDTRVIPARLFGRKQVSGGRVELLLERVIAPRKVIAQARPTRSLKLGTQIALEGGARAEVTGRDGELLVLEFDRPALAFAEAHGHVPLPPYIKRSDQELDRHRYQTVYARRPGAVAAPTAGLHFDEVLINRILSAGVEIAYLTLHVGAGTFQPVRVDDVREHCMHAERVEVDAQLCELIDGIRRSDGRVIAVGTTVVRALETAAKAGKVEPFSGETDIFIYPGFRFRVVDAMLTNFHLPESTLLMLVCAFAGRDRVLAAYHHALNERYRFFSYGDAMFVTPSDEARS